MLFTVYYFVAFWDDCPSRRRRSRIRRGRVLDCNSPLAFRVRYGWECRHLALGSHYLRFDGRNIYWKIKIPSIGKRNENWLPKRRNFRHHGIRIVWYSYLFAQGTYSDWSTRYSRSCWYSVLCGNGDSKLRRYRDLNAPLQDKD